MCAVERVPHPNAQEAQNLDGVKFGEEGGTVEIMPLGFVTNWLAELRTANSKFVAATYTREVPRITNRKITDGKDCPTARSQVTRG